MWTRITAIMLSFWMSVNPVYEAGMMKIIAEASPIARSEDDENIDIAKPENTSDTDDSDQRDTEPQATETPSADPGNPESDYPEPSTEPTPVPTEPALPDHVTPEPVSPEPATPEPSTEPAAPEWAQMFDTYALDFFEEKTYRESVTSELYNADEQGKFQTEIIFSCKYNLKEDYSIPEGMQIPDIEIPIIIDDQYISRTDGVLWLYEFYNGEHNRIEVESTPTDDVNIWSCSLRLNSTTISVKTAFSIITRLAHRAIRFSPYY